MNGVAPRPPCAVERVLATAWGDASQVYRQLAGYRVSLSLEPDGCHVDFHPKSPTAFGDGPRYLIDPATGDILSRVYEQ